MSRSRHTPGSTLSPYTTLFRSTNPASGTDFVGGAFPTGTVTFTTGVTSQTITIDVNGDTTVETDGAHACTLATRSPRMPLPAPARATRTIQNDDSTTLAIAAAS